MEQVFRILPEITMLQKEKRTEVRYFLKVIALVITPGKATIIYSGKIAAYRETGRRFISV